MVFLLNPEAPEFFPSHNHKLQQQPQPLPCPNNSTSILAPLPLHHFYFAFSSFPSRQLNPFYYPTTTLPPPSIPLHDATITIPLTSEAEPTRLHNMRNYPSPVEAHAVSQKKDEVVVAESKTGGSKGFVKKQVLKAFISCGTLDSRRSDNLRLKGFPRRGKVEENIQRKNVDYLRNRKVIRHPNEQCFRGIPKRKRCYPSMPVRVDGNETTVMIRNVPSKYSRDMLVEFLENHCMQVNLRDEEGGKEKDEEFSALAFDFVYLPIDFKSGMNKGYAFVNFTKPQAAWKFLLTASNMKWDLFQSHKIREVVSARLQGKKKLENHFETMNFPCESEDVLPVCFSPPRDGVIKGKQRTVGRLIKRHQV